MKSSRHKLPLGIIALCATSLFGLKDTGVFINEHVQKTYGGNEIEFSVGEEVQIIEEKDDGYYVAKGKAKVTIPRDKILVKELDVPTYQIVKASPIFDDNGLIIRSLFIDEYAVGISINGDKAKIKCNDGTVGFVSRDALKKISDKRDNVTKVTVKNDVVAKSGGKSLNLKAGETADVVDYDAGHFVVRDDNNAKYKVPAKNLDIVSGQKIEKPVVKEEAKVPKESKQIVKLEAQKAPEAPAVVATKASGSAAKVITSAENKLGSTYVYGATGNGGYDCSGLVYSIYVNELGVKLPRSSREQSQYGMQVSKSDLKQGDLVFFNTTGSGVSHVGIYVGDGKFIHASSGQGKVITSSLAEDYYENAYVNATRVL
ncbi:C40 family peptidase [Peptoniphilus sp.]|uniref:C40 family peptidase n=1 Tax=Peptoniphilus sp. TaxID=1971214 RepID=UPI003D8C0722